ncbi:MAG: M23 family metallopeptidase [Dehalococcoidia bacterium]|nr:MAG: M23 family metallopeptidase [Dehalococcoidia bacterium]
MLRTGLAAGLALPLAACTRRGNDAGPAVRVAAASPTPERTAATPAVASPTAARTPTPTPTPTATPPPPPPTPATIEFRPSPVGNGEATLLTVRATERRGQIRFLGQTVPLRQQGEILWAILGVPIDAAPGPRSAEVTLLDANGATSQRVTATVTVATLERPIDYLEVTEEVQSILTPQAAALEEQLRTKEFAAFDPAARWEKPFIRPVAGDISTQFGSGRSVNGGPVGGFHSGADIANDAGTPIVAAGPGRVAFVEAHPIRGISVIIDHGAGVKSGYHHLEAALVMPEETVEAGTLIGRMGTTGYSTGPHLHWEVTVYGVNVDPVTWTQTTFRP